MRIPSEVPSQVGRPRLSRLEYRNRNGARIVLLLAPEEVEKAARELESSGYVILRISNGEALDAILSA